jgi:hypothetical protein
MAISKMLSVDKKSLTSIMVTRNNRLRGMDFSKLPSLT